MAKPKPKRKKRKEKRKVPHAVMNIHSNFNNTIITIADKEGNVLNWSSAGFLGFKGSKKSTPFAAQIAAEKVLESVESYNIQTMDIKVKGPGPGRDSAIKAVGNTNIRVLSIRDNTPIPHNGCRPKKKRRV